MKLLDLVKEECDFFNLSTTGMAYYDDVIKKGHLSYHPSPNQKITQDNSVKFILKYLNKKQYGLLAKKNMEYNNYSVNYEKVLKIMNNMRNGIKYDTPMIDLIDIYNFQEGRHRTIAASNLGCDLIPVYVFGTDIQLNKIRTN